MSEIKKEEMFKKLANAVDTGDTKAAEEGANVLMAVTQRFIEIPPRKSKPGSAKDSP